jgi:hypothetical protein
MEIAAISALSPSARILALESNWKDFVFLRWRKSAVDAVCESESGGTPIDFCL